MLHIDEKFKDTSPEQTIQRIQEILKGVGIVLEEKGRNAGIDNCWSSHVAVEGGYPFFSNGKGVTQNLSRASAYAEFIERLQCGLFLYKFQSIGRDPATDLHRFAPDGKFMTMAELVAEGEWMDYVIESYGHGLTRQKLAKLCKDYAAADEDKIWVVPFYSLFEDKYVYLPAGIVEHVYATNGCCAGNSREEAWVHGLSEMMERRSTLTRLMSGEASPVIPDEVLSKFTTATKIIEKIRQTGKYDVQVFDLSMDNGFPVIATRIINKKTQDYVVNIGADPVLEIAINRTLTEIFQGKDLETFSSSHANSILKSITDVPYSHNALNQMETGNGLFTVDFFAEELTCQRPCTDFEDNSGKSNGQLLEYMLGLYRKLGRPVYVRNFSFLGFCSYHFVVPGFSETRGMLLTEPVGEYAMGAEAAKVLRNPTAANEAGLAFLLMFHNKIKSMLSRKDNFAGLAGLPLVGNTRRLLYATLSYAAWRLKQYPAAVSYLEALRRYSDEQTRDYFACVGMYLKLLSSGVSGEKIRLVLGKFFDAEPVRALYERLDNGRSPYDGYLLSCDLKSCADCQYRENCSYDRVKEIIASVGAVYSTFTDGQSKDNFLFT
ncbi:MAG: hypothetical protein E7466_04020 [Ruminococcaceae bacterium]|nr:hypothetical protein [Oscillospiraceae bacterium]